MENGLPRSHKDKLRAAATDVENQAAFGAIGTRAEITPRALRRASSSPSMISRGMPAAWRTDARNRAPLAAARKAAVPTALTRDDLFSVEDFPDFLQGGQGSLHGLGARAPLRG